MLRLTSLAPDIIEAILRGDESDGLSLEKLRKNLPVRWEEQRDLWRLTLRMTLKSTASARLICSCPCVLLG